MCKSKDKVKKKFFVSLLKKKKGTQRVACIHSLRYHMPIHRSVMIVIVDRVSSDWKEMLMPLYLVNHVHNQIQKVILLVRKIVYGLIFTHLKCQTKQLVYQSLYGFMVVAIVMVLQINIQ